MCARHACGAVVRVVRVGARVRSLGLLPALRIVLGRASGSVVGAYAARAGALGARELKVEIGPVRNESIGTARPTEADGRRSGETRQPSTVSGVCSGTRRSGEFARPASLCQAGVVAHCAGSRAQLPQWGQDAGRVQFCGGRASRWIQAATDGGPRGRRCHRQSFKCRECASRKEGCEAFGARRALSAS